jgi:hypothetical protein
MDNAELNAFIERVYGGLGADPSDDEILEATTAAFRALSEAERRSIDRDELVRRLAVYRSVEFG